MEMSGSQAGFNRVRLWSFYCSPPQGLTNPHRLPPDPEVGRETFIFTIEGDPLLYALSSDTERAFDLNQVD